MYYWWRVLNYRSLDFEIKGVGASSLEYPSAQRWLMATQMSHIRIIIMGERNTNHITSYTNLNEGL